MTYLNPQIFKLNFKKLLGERNSLEIQFCLACTCCELKGQTLVLRKSQSLFSIKAIGFKYSRYLTFQQRNNYPERLPQGLKWRLSLGLQFPLTCRSQKQWGWWEIASVCRVGGHHTQAEDAGWTWKPGFGASAISGRWRRARSVGLKGQDSTWRTDEEKLRKRLYARLGLWRIEHKLHVTRPKEVFLCCKKRTPLLNNRTTYSFYRFSFK